MKGAIYNIDHNTAIDFLLPRHYSGRKPRISRAWGWYDCQPKDGILPDNSHLKAVCTIGKPASPPLCVGICGPENSQYVYELNRLCRADDWNEPLSQFIGAILRQCRINNWIVVSLFTAWTGLTARPPMNVQPRPASDAGRYASRRQLMKWTSEKPKRAGYYWYLGPVMKRDFDRIANGSDIRDCTWGPIIAGVGICLNEIPSGDGNPHHEKMWSEGRIVVEFYGSTVRRTLAEMPKEVLWAGPITPPVSDWAWHLQPKDKIQATPFEAEIDASEITAWSEACRKAEGYFNPDERL